MANPTLRELVRRILSGGLAVSGAAGVTPAAVPVSVSPDFSPESHPDMTARLKIPETVVREARPRVVIRQSTATSFNLLSSHRSHRSHQSHRSSSSPPAPTKAPAPTKKSAPTTAPPARPQTLLSTDSAAPERQLGSRVLSVGMKGADVEQLLTLLVKRELLAVSKIPAESIFNSDVEAAIKKFQKDKGLTADGRVDFRTLLLLRAQ